MTSELFTLNMLSNPNASSNELLANGMERFTDKLPQVDRYTRFSQLQYRGIRVGSFGITLEPSVLYEILESAKISPLPGVNAICKGLVNHRSNVAPVYDLTELTATTPKVWERKRLLILNSGENTVGIILYELPAQIRTTHQIKQEEIIDVPDIFYRHASGAYWANDMYWLILNRELFFTELNELCVQFK